MLTQPPATLRNFEPLSLPRSPLKTSDVCVVGEARSLLRNTGNSVKRQ